jgi:ferredoxin
MPAFKGKSDIPRSEVFASKTPVGDKLEHFGQILPIEDVEQVIDMVDTITRMPCGCRYISTCKTDKRYCFGISIDKWGMLGTFPDSASSLERLSKQEAKKIIHSVWTGVTPYIVGICNCDHDCGAFGGYIEHGGTPSFFKAEYIYQVNIELCNGCKACMSQCQFGAQFYSSALSKVYISAEKCFGCGVCRAVCPTNAIELIPRIPTSIR